MAIKIQTKQTYIPIELGDLELKFDLTDESIANFRKEAVRVQKELGKLSDDEDAQEQAKEVLKRGFDLMFGDGTFSQIYDISPSSIVIAEYFASITEGIAEELNKRGFKTSQKDKAKKYLANKKK
ncbi:MAG TPA: hypothetical protein VK107_05305 [Alloiococcus sp.]|nr:hypothetical protein [Alloiococcus sp.]